MASALNTEESMATRAVFLSYARPDREIVAPIAALVRGTRAAVFRDEESIPPGRKWKLAITDAIHSCETLFVFWSTAAAKSEAVEREYELAISLGKPIVPILLDDTPLAQALEEYQWVDFRTLIRTARNRSNGQRAFGHVPVISLVRAILDLIRSYNEQAVSDLRFTEHERLAMLNALLAQVVRPAEGAAGLPPSHLMSS